MSGGHPTTGRRYADIVVRLRGARRIKRLPALVRKAGLRGLTRDGGLVPSSQAAALARLGCELFAALGGASQKALRSRRSNQFGTRLWLEQPASRVDPGPWEVIADPIFNPPERLALNVLTPVIRRLVVPSDARRRRVFEPIDGPLQILVIGASPESGDYERLAVSKERRRLERALQNLTARGAIELSWIGGSNTADQLASHLSDRTCHVLHFVGHGVVAADGTGSLVFEGPHHEPHEVSAQALSAQLAGHDVRLAILNCCRGALADRRRAVPSMAAILAQYLPAVIGMQAAISDEAGLRFSQAFYAALAHGRPLEVAVTEARHRLQLLCTSSHPYLEWATPVLFLSKPDVLDIRTLVAAKAPTGRRTRRARLRKVLTAIPEVGGRRDPPPGDNQKFQWGGLSSRNGRRVGATVERAGADWYRITLTVVGTRRRPLVGQVVFHLHETFDEPVRRVQARGGRATLTMVAWGAFTVGVECDNRRTRLELDLSEVADAPKRFRES